MPETEQVKPVEFTSQQRDAIQATSGSVIVSAAAGSGKTAVLTERCAYLVSDAPEPARCGVRDLLVLTFTESAAAEMKSRIADALDLRCRERPNDARLARERALVGGAQISTIHAFCLWCLRRWFREAAIDPHASLMDEHEAQMLRREVMEDLLSRLYDEGANARVDGLGAAGQPSWSDSGSTAAWFVRLVDEYGHGNDGPIVAFLNKVHDYLESLASPSAWVRDVRARQADDPAGVVIDYFRSLGTELAALRDAVAPSLDDSWDKASKKAKRHLEELRGFCAHADAWIEALSAPGYFDGDQAATLERLEALRQAMVAAACFSGKAPGGKAANSREVALGELFMATRKAFRELIEKQFLAVSVPRCVSDAKSLAPYASVILEVVEAFGEAYRQAKRRANLMDFSDLERLTLSLLTTDGDPARPTGVALELRERFKHVLVDEFQDINPVQEAILLAVSRETAGRDERGEAGSFFVVGDVKQSIYRFRLAEPSLFISRLDDHARADSPGRAIMLSENFRSRREVIDSVNVLFRRIMRRAWGGIDYDRSAELVFRRDKGKQEGHVPVELHILEDKAFHSNDADGGDGGDGADSGEEKEGAPLDDPASWTPAQREAYVIAGKIRDWTGPGGMTVDDRPARLGDFVVLLRATKFKAAQMAAMLHSLGIPAHADEAGSLFETMEVRVVRAGLQVIDNGRQDIPLAAVLRHGLFGRPLSPDELVTLRMILPGRAFHEVVWAVADGRLNKASVPKDLRDELVNFAARINRYRNAARRRPVSELLAQLLRNSGFAAYVGGLPDGDRRRVNLDQFHDLARRFGSFRRQGLDRFLAFLETLEENEDALGPAVSPASLDSVVRVMSMHRSKGLQFPVVFAAGLGTGLNMSDRSGPMILDRQHGIGMNVVDNARMIEYPSTSHRLASAAIEQASREEELRILYVAMTRARDKLVLLGARAKVHTLETRPVGRFEARDFQSAGSPLDWILSGLGDASGSEVAWADEVTESAPWQVTLHTGDEISAWDPPDRAGRGSDPIREAVARLEPLSARPSAEAMAKAERVLDRVAYVYPYLGLTSVRSAIGASELAHGDMEAAREMPPSDDGDDGAVRRWVRLGFAADAGDDPARKGTIVHRVLEHLDFARARDRAGLDREIERMRAGQVLADEDVELLDLEPIVWFLGTPLAERIRKAGRQYHREFSYIAAEAPERIDPDLHVPGDDFVLVRGIVDGLLVSADGLEIIDFKTDRVTEEGVRERAAHYRRQVEAYAGAMARLWSRPVTAARLVFLTPRLIVDLPRTMIAG